MRIVVASMVMVLAQVNPATAAESQCFGTVNKGRIEGSVKLPTSGANFTAYSSLGSAAGRTHVHSKVAEIVEAAYAAVASSDPSLTFVYGETGWPSGGRIRPHRSHQNGLSVDFFVPVRNKARKSVTLPTSIPNRLGYDIEFDKDAKYGEYSIDFAAMAEHLYQTACSCKGKGSRSRSRHLRYNVLVQAVRHPARFVPGAEPHVHEGASMGASRRALPC
jgi:penicillin-insensitive murein endopeptidase